jgi:hypothetical protein
VERVVYATFDPMVLGLAHGVLVAGVILVIGLPLLAIVGIIWYVQKM